MMTTTTATIAVDARSELAYWCWAGVGNALRFIDELHDIERLEDGRQRWHLTLGGRARQWTVEIRERIPGLRISWLVVEGPMHAGTVTFEDLDTCRTRVRLELTYEPETMVERVAALLGAPRRRADAALQGFKDFVESLPAIPLDHARMAAAAQARLAASA